MPRSRSNPRVLFAALCALVSCPGCRGHGPVTEPTAPAAIPTGAGYLKDSTTATGIQVRLGHSDLHHVSILDGIGHGCAFLDFDSDGKTDILFVTNGSALLYRNSGGRFEDVTARALPAPPPHAHFLGCAVADYDGDGRPDIFLTGYGCTALYHNEGGGRFRDATRGSGLEARGPYDWTTSAAWADVDGDGLLDLYVCRYVEFTPNSKQLCGQKALDGANLTMACSPTTYPAQRGSLYRNLGNGRFRDVTAASGLSDCHGNSLGCIFCDVNGDGRPDLLVANDLKPADLYLNLGHGRFRNAGAEAGVAFGADGGLMSGMGVDCGDYDNDGRFDLLAANYARQPKSLFHNEGRSFFTNASYGSGIGAPSLLPLTFGAAFFDIDNDGWLDIVLANGHVDSLAERVDSTMTYFQSTQIFRNLGNGHFDDISGRCGPDLLRKIVGRGMAVGDYDGDGRQDLLIVNEEGEPLLLHNATVTTNHWISLRCLWHKPGTDAIGARVALTAGALREIAEVRASGSYLSTNEPTVHFGFGANPVVDSLEVRWPDGRRSAFRNVAGDHAYAVTPGDAAPRRLR